MNNLFRLGVTLACFSLCVTGASYSEKPERAVVHVPYRILTQEGKSYWFGYYDKLLFDPSNRYVLGMEVDFDKREPRPDDEIRLGMFDLHNNNQWIEFGKTTAWCWQQGCMLQWLPGSDCEVIYNVRRDNGFGSVIQNVFTGKKRKFSRPIYTVSPNGKEALSIDFARLNETRPGYGYVGIQYDWTGRDHPDDDGIYLLDLETGKSKLVITYDQIVSTQTREDMKSVRSWFNHLLYNPNGTRFVFLHRWFRNPDNTGGRYTRFFTANRDGSGICLLADHDMTSHFIWRNPTQILAWSTEPEGNYFHIYTDQSNRVETIGKGILKQDGHCSYSPDRHWISTDTYPDSRHKLVQIIIDRHDRLNAIVYEIDLPAARNLSFDCLGDNVAGKRHNARIYR